jgi:beta-N-acetylhexosaminidase
LRTHLRNGTYRSNWPIAPSLWSRISHSPSTGQGGKAGSAAAGLTAALQPDLAATGGRIVASPADAQVIVAATQDAVSDPAQQQLVHGLVATGTPVVVLATGLPYDLGLFAGMRAAVASYSDSAVSLSAAAAVLTGRLRPVGQLPVAIPAVAGGTAFRYGTGLSY